MCLNLYIRRKMPRRKESEASQWCLEDLVTARNRRSQKQVRIQVGARRENPNNRWWKKFWMNRTWSLLKETLIINSETETLGWLKASNIRHKTVWCKWPTDLSAPKTQLLTTRNKVAKVKWINNPASVSQSQRWNAGTKSTLTSIKPTNQNQTTNIRWWIPTIQLLV